MSNYADETQIARLLEEAMPYDEVAIRANVDRTTAFRWQQKGYASMPWATATLICAQIDGMVQLNPAQITALYEHRSRAALGRSRPRRSMPAWTKEDDKPKQEERVNEFD